MKKVIMVLMVMSVFACKTKEKTQEVAPAPVLQSANQQKEQRETIETPAKDEKVYSVLIAFFSIGAGIDFDRKAEMDGYLEQLVSEKVDFSVEKVAWGREGEVDYCVDLSKLKAAEQKRIIEKIQVIAKKSSWIDVKLNQECRFKNIQR